MKGWGFYLPTASAILTVLWPNEFTVFDTRVCDELIRDGLGDFRRLGNAAEERVWPGYCRYREAVERAGPWTVPHRMGPGQPKPGQQAGNLLLLAIAISVAISAALLARRNYMQGRGDRRGASRLAYVVLALLVGLWLCQGHLVPSWDVFLPLILAISTALLYTGLVWVLYLSLEPYVRRRWPQILISWSRLLMGQIRDPLVGRDLLLGVILAVFWLLIFQVRYMLLMRLGAHPDLQSTEYLSGTRLALGAWLRNIPGSIQGTLLFFFLLFEIHRF